MLVLACKHSRADDDAETNPMSLENVAEEIYGKSKKENSLFSSSTAAAAAVGKEDTSASAAAEQSQLKFRFRLIRRKIARARATREKMEASLEYIHMHRVPWCAAREAMRDHSFRAEIAGGLFTQHQTFTFSQQFNAHQR